MSDARTAQQARTLHHTMARAGISVLQLWWHYFSLGGNTDALEVEAYLHQALHLSRFDRLLLDQAARELTDHRPG